MVCSITYRGGYKYQLHADYVIDIPVVPKIVIATAYIELDENGMLIIKKGYAWDGPSGPTIDTPSSMRGSLVHDALYQLMRMGRLDHVVCRPVADKLLHDICLQDGMCHFRAWYFYWGVRRFANFAADPSDKKPLIFAPREP